MHVVDVVRTYLELRSPDQLRPSHSDDPRLAFVRRDRLPPSEYRRLYRDVGAAHYWRDRLIWTDNDIAAHLLAPDIAVWEALVDGESAGYFELKSHDDGSIEIAYFGLLPAFIGRGYGGAMLTRAAEQAWAHGAKRVWLHTCTLDSPHALPNYRARGFEPFKQETYQESIADPR
jgi:GNAT superfamily N-acetyltransferase